MSRSAAPIDDPEPELARPEIPAEIVRVAVVVTTVALIALALILIIAGIAVLRLDRHHSAEAVPQQDEPAPAPENLFREAGEGNSDSP